jgi:hypothetical protein
MLNPGFAPDVRLRLAQRRPGLVIGALALASLQAIEWLAARIWWVIGTTVLSAALTVAAVLWLMRWTIRREAALAAERATLRVEQVCGISTERGGSGRQIGTRMQDSRTIEGGLHIHLHGLDATEQAEVIRQALTADVQHAVQSRLLQDPRLNDPDRAGSGAIRRPESVGRRLIYWPMPCPAATGLVTDREQTVHNAGGSDGLHDHH